MSSEESYSEWYFLGICLIIFTTTVLIYPHTFLKTSDFFFSIILKIIPVFIMVFLLLALFNYFIKPKQLARHLGKESGIKGWFIAVFAGIISTGPIYMWYPLLNELKKHGARSGIIATFLYTRAVKPAMIPLMIFYFGLVFTLVLTVVMIVFSILQGMVIESIMEMET